MPTTATQPQQQPQPPQEAAPQSMAQEQPPLPEQQQQQPAQSQSLTATAREKFTPELCASTIQKLPPQLQCLAQTFAQPFVAFRKAFKDPAEADRVMAKEIDFAAQAMLANPYLITCATSNPVDLVNALKNIALTGSTLNPTLKQGYLVPFKGRIQFMPSYMGLVDLLHSTGLMRKIEAHAVFEGDEFSVSHGTGGGLRHKPDPWGKRDKEHMKGCYYYAVLSDGSEMFDTMSREEIDAVMRRSPSVGKGKSSPWDTDYTEMSRKTLLRRAFKAIPKNGISESKLRAVEAAFDYDEKAEQDWVRTQRGNRQRGADPLDLDPEEYEEVRD